MDYKFLFFGTFLGIISTTIAQTNNFEQLVDVRLGTIEAILNSLVSRMDAGFFQIDSKINTNLERVSTEQAKLQNQIGELKMNGVQNLSTILQIIRTEVSEVKQKLENFEPNQGLYKVIEETSDTLQSINKTCFEVKEIVYDKFRNFEKFGEHSGEDISEESNTTNIYDNYEKLQIKIESQAAQGLYLLTTLKTGMINNEKLCGKANKSTLDLIEDFEQIPRRDEWLVIQSRGMFQHKPRIGFARVFAEYEKGFGKYDGDFWLGLNKIHAFTSLGYTDLKFVIRNWDGIEKFAQYGNFTIGDTRDNYRLSLGSYSGNAGDSFGNHIGQQFSTVDSDNDSHFRENCARLEGGNGGWWYKQCKWSNLNGLYKSAQDSSDNGIFWGKWEINHSFKASEMMVRIPRSYPNNKSNLNKQ